MFLFRTKFKEICSIVESLENKFPSGDDELRNVRERVMSLFLISELPNQLFSPGVFPDIIKKLRDFRFIKRALKQTRTFTGQYHSSMFGATFLEGLCTTDFTHTSQNLSFSMETSLVLGKNVVLLMLSFN